MTGESAGQQDRHVLFVDGVCVLCHHLVRFVLKIDHRAVLSFSTLQGETARRLFAGHAEAEAQLRSLASVVYVRHCERPGQEIFYRSTAALRSLRDLGGFWWVLSWFTLIPRPLRDWVYDVIARCRYRWFGKHEEACPLPLQEHAGRFLA